MLATFAPRNMKPYTATPEARRRCIVGRAPSLAVVADAWGEETADLWLTGYVAAVYQACGQKIEAAQIDALAAAIMAEHSDLKLTDLLLFASKLFAGAWGHFYADADISRLGTMLQAYRVWREGEIARYQAEADRQRAAQTRADMAAHGMSMAAYLSAVGEITQSQHDFYARFMASTPDDSAALARVRVLPDPPQKDEKQNKPQNATIGNQGY